MYDDQYFLDYEYFGERFMKVLELYIRPNRVVVVVNQDCSSESVQTLLKYLTITKVSIPCHEMNTNNVLEAIVIQDNLAYLKVGVLLIFLPLNRIELLLRGFNIPRITIITTNLPRPIYQYLQESYPQSHIYNILSYSTNDLSKWRENSFIISPKDKDSITHR